MICIVGECNADRLLGDFELIKTDFADIAADSVAVIVGKNARLTVRAALGIIVEEDFTLSFPRGIQLITCGISSKNTVSITSRTDERLTLSLNRSIRAEHGLCEPLEYPVEVRPDMSEFDLMAAFVARLLVGGE